MQSQPDLQMLPDMCLSSTEFDVSGVIATAPSKDGKLLYLGVHGTAQLTDKSYVMVIEQSSRNLLGKSV